MSKPFDATLNSLIDAHEADWAELLCTKLGIPFAAIEQVDSDLSTTLQADKVFKLQSPRPCLLHLELQANPRRHIPQDLLRYNVFLAHLHRLPVHSFVILLRPKANASDLTGLLELIGANGETYLSFSYTVIRLREESLTTLMAGSLGTVPLALLTDEAAGNLPGAFAPFEQRLRSESIPDSVKETLFGSLYVLPGLRYRPESIESIYRSITMLLEDSTTYQMLLRRGELRVLRIQGLQRFGKPTGDVEATLKELEMIEDRERLERMAARIFDATSWDDLLATA